MTLLDHVVLQVDDLNAIGDWYDQIVSLAGGTRTFDMPNLPRTQMPSRCSGLTGQQAGRPYSASLRWTMASYSCSYVIGGSGIGCARSAR